MLPGKIVLGRGGVIVVRRDHDIAAKPIGPAQHALMRNNFVRWHRRSAPPARVPNGRMEQPKYEGCRKRPPDHDQIPQTECDLCPAKASQNTPRDLLEAQIRDHGSGPVNSGSSRPCLDVDRFRPGHQRGFRKHRFCQPARSALIGPGNRESYEESEHAAEEGSNKQQHWSTHQRGCLTAGLSRTSPNGSRLRPDAAYRQTSRLLLSRRRFLQLRRGRARRWIDDTS
jgi:hypothetical protein